MAATARAEPGSYSSIRVSLVCGQLLHFRGTLAGSCIHGRIVLQPVPGSKTHLHPVAHSPIACNCQGRGRQEPGAPHSIQVSQWLARHCSPVISHGSWNQKQYLGLKPGILMKDVGIKAVDQIPAPSCFQSYFWQTIHIFTVQFDVV